MAARTAANLAATALLALALVAVGVKSALASPADDAVRCSIVVRSTSTLHAKPYLSEPAAEGAAVTTSLHDAARAVRDALAATSAADGDVVVCLDPGIHELGGRTLRLSSEHSDAGGSRRVVWQPSPHAQEADVHVPASVVSGGAQVTGWAPAPNTHAGKDGITLFRAPLPAATKGLAAVRILWVDGQRMNRTVISSASLGLTPTATGYTANATLPAWKDPTSVELRWPSQIRNWIDPRCTLSAVSGATMTVQGPCFTALTARAGKTPPAPKLLENADMPSSAGEFFADMAGGYVYLAPPAGFDPVTSEAWVPVQQVLLNGTGVTGHTWSGIAFQYSQWLGPNTPYGYVPSQTGVHSCAGVDTADARADVAVREHTTTTTYPPSPQDASVGAGSCEPVGAVHFSAGKSLTFDGCNFTAIGSLYALSVGGASNGVTVSHSTFRDLSGGFVKLGNVDDARAVSKDPAQWDQQLTLSRCAASDASIEFLGCAGVFAGYVAHTRITNNTIQDTGYTGVSVGWGWGSVVSFAQDNHVTFNAISNVMKSLVDGGGIYTLGPQPASTVSGNYIAGDHAEFGALYRDNGSRYIHDSFNVVRNAAAPVVFLQGCCGKPALNLTVDHIWYQSTQPVRNDCVPQGCVVDSSTVYNVAAGQPWPAAAQGIVDGAGAAAPAV